MLKAVKASLAFMTPKERSKWYFLTGGRAALSVLDLAGILAIGFVVTSTAIFLTQGSSPGRVLDFAGLRIPAVTAQTLPLVAVVILSAFLLKACLSIVITKLAAYHVATIEARAAKTISEKVFGADLSRVRLRSREEMAFAIQFGSPAAFNSLLNYSSTALTEGSLFILICLGFLLIDPLATVAAIAYFALIAFVIQYFVGTLMARAGEQAAKSTIEANGAVGDLIAVFRELSVLGLRHKYIDRIYESRVSAADSAATQTYLSGMPRYIVEAALLVGVAAFILVQALTGDVVSSAATVGVFLSGGFRLTAAMLPLQSSLLNIRGSLPAAQKAHEILFDTELVSRSTVARNVSSKNFNQSLDSEPLGVQFVEVSFSYPNSSQAVIRDISLSIDAGDQIAFIGPSGAGKSTLADLMCGVLEPTSGTITLGPNWEVFPRVSYVPQRPGLVSGTVAQNVALGLVRDEVDEAKVWDALEKAHLREVVQALPQNIQTDLGNYQDGLSGGQIQRLGLARALYTSPGLLVMDEATSALDAESEAEITRALDQIRGKVTVVLIAHRLNTVQHADKVFLINDGKLTDQGKFPELVKRYPAIDRLVQLMKVKE
jgi:ATP-binding cassette, subfamily B, bacterial PglK